jgi:hypothetical protein
MMRKLIGLLGGLALIGTAWAADPNTKDKTQSTERTSSASTESTTSDKKSTTGAGEIDRSKSSSQLGDSSGTLSKNELTGRVVRADNNMVWIDHLGAVVPLKIENNTKFESAGVTRAKDLKEGQEIRANFTVKDKTTNVATTIWLEGATSTGKTGASDMDMQHRTTTTPKSPAVPEDRGNRPGTPPGDVK